METQILVNSKILLTALEYAKKVMVKNPVVPILENYLIEVDGNTMRIVASDLQNSVIVTIAIESKATFKACLTNESIKYLKKVDGLIFMSYDPGNYAIIFEENDGRFKYSGENFENFPMQSQPIEHLFDLPVGTEKEFKDLLNYTSSDELQPAMTGINFGMHDKKFYLCATDGHTLKTVNLPTLDKDYGPQTEFILPSKAAKILSESKINSDMVVRELTQSEFIKLVSFSFISNVGNVEIITRSIDEVYPSYFDVIPTDSSTQFTFESKVFLKALDKVELFANKTTHQIRLSLNGVNQISAEDLDFSHEGCMHVDGSYTGNEIEIGFNGEFLKKAIKSFGESVTIEMTKPNKCGVIKDSKSLVLFMPVMLTKYE